MSSNLQEIQSRTAQCVEYGTINAGLEVDDVNDEIKPGRPSS